MQSRYFNSKKIMKARPLVPQVQNGGRNTLLVLLCPALWPGPSLLIHTCLGVFGWRNPLNDLRRWSKEQLNPQESLMLEKGGSF